MTNEEPEPNERGRAGQISLTDVCALSQQQQRTAPPSLQAPAGFGASDFSGLSTLKQRHLGGEAPAPLLQASGKQASRQKQAAQQH